MKTSLKFLAVFHLLTVLCLAAHAQGAVFTYQGRLNNNANPVSGAYDLKFSLFNTNSGGVVFAGPVTNDAVAISNGLFTTMVDFGSGAFTGGSNWLEIAVRPNGNGTFNTLSPRQRLTPAPYAIFAASANNLTGLVVQQNANGAPNLIGGSSGNYVSNGVMGATIAGGGVANFFGGYYTNSVTANFATVSGGFGNTASGEWATVGGGSGDTASGEWAAVGGGFGNTASGTSATVGGGDKNTASGVYATVAGGSRNIASGSLSFAAGEDAQALHDGSFVWSDETGTIFASTANNQFSVRAAGGIRLAGDVAIEGGANTYHHLGLNGGNSTGYLYGSYPYFGDGVHLGYNFYADDGGGPHVTNPGGGTSRLTATYGELVLAVGDVGFGPNQVRLDATLAGVTVYGTFNNLSDRNAKQDFAPVSSSAILDAVLQLPVSEWSYKEDAATRHIGPVAQDFHSAFNIGTDDKHIAPIDEGGVALAAIQGLNQKLSEELKRRDVENAELRRRLDALETIIRNQKSN